MTYPLCRHIMPTGAHCQSPSVTNNNFCYSHSRQRSITARPKRYGSVRIPFQFPEDRAAIQINYHLAVQSIAEGKLEPRQANAIINAYRAAATNLKAGPLVPARLKHRVERVILTPDEEEVAPAREACLPGENLTHGPNCPCGYCAEIYRDAPGELHHPDCNCGLCHEEEQVEKRREDKSEASKESVAKDVVIPSEVEEPAVNSSCHPGPAHDAQQPLSRRDAEIIALYQAAEAELAKNAHHNKPAPAAITIPTILATADPNHPPRSAKIARTVAAPPLTGPEISDDDDADEPAPSYETVLREYRAEQAARQSPTANGSSHGPAAPEWRGTGVPVNGSSPVGRKARTPGQSALSNAIGRVLPEGVRRYNQLMAEVERNKQLAEESWQRYVAAEEAAGRAVVDPLANRAVLVTNPDGTTTKRYLTWNEEEDRRIAHRRRLLEQEQSRELA